MLSVDSSLPRALTSTSPEKVIAFTLRVCYVPDSKNVALGILTLHSLPVEEVLADPFYPSVSSD